MSTTVVATDIGSMVVTVDASGKPPLSMDIGERWTGKSKVGVFVLLHSVDEIFIM